MMNLDSLFAELAESLGALQRSVVLLLPRLGVSAPGKRRPRPRTISTPASAHQGGARGLHQRAGDRYRDGAGVCSPGVAARRSR
jgi:hypothetical protein